MPWNPDAYTRRILAARRVHLGLDRQYVARLQAAMDRYADELAVAVRRYGYSPEDQRQALIKALDRLSRNLKRELVNTTEAGVRVQFSKIRGVMDQVTRQAIREAASPVPYFPAPPLTMAAAYMARGGTAEAFRTLSVAVDGAAAGVEDLVVTSLAEGWGPEQLARRIRPFVKGQGGFSAEELKDLRKVPKARRDAARQLQFNARRIAVTEMGNAAHEAQIQAMLEAPMVQGARWRLSPVRGTQVKPDECDILAKQDFYDMGPGVYPVHRIPTRPHPNDRCWLQDVTRPVQDWGKPKPEPTLQGRRPTDEGIEELTEAAKFNAQRSAYRALRNGAEADRMRRSEIRRVQKTRRAG